MLRNMYKNPPNSSFFSPTAVDSSKQLENIAKSGNVHHLLALLNQGVSLRLSPGTTKHNLMYWGMFNKDSNMRKFVSSPEVTSQFLDGTTQLHIAVANENIDAVRNLVTNSEVDIFATNFSGDSAFSYAFALESKEMVYSLINCKKFKDVSFTVQSETLENALYPRLMLLTESLVTEPSIYIKEVSAFTCFLIRLELPFPGIQKMIGIYYSCIGLVSSNESLLDEAVEAFQLAIISLGNLHDSDPDKSSYLTNIYNYLAQIYLRKEDYRNTAITIKLKLDHLTKLNEINHEMNLLCFQTISQLSRIEACQHLAISNELSIPYLGDPNNGYVLDFYSTFLKLAAHHHLPSIACLTTSSLREEVVAYLVKHRNVIEEHIGLPFSSYLNTITQSTFFVDTLQVIAISELYKITLYILATDSPLPKIIKQANSVATFFLAENIDYVPLIRLKPQIKADIEIESTIANCYELEPVIPYMLPSTPNIQFDSDYLPPSPSTVSSLNNNDILPLRVTNLSSSNASIRTQTSPSQFYTSVPREEADTTQATRCRTLRTFSSPSG